MPHTFEQPILRETVDLNYRIVSESDSDSDDSLYPDMDRILHCRHHQDSHDLMIVVQKLIDILLRNM